LAALAALTVHRAELLASLRPAEAGGVHRLMPLKLMCALSVAEATAPVQTDGANIDMAFATLLAEACVDAFFLHARARIVRAQCARISEHAQMRVRATRFSGALRVVSEARSDRAGHRP
jgi:hypothetical protein